MMTAEKWLLYNKKCPFYTGPSDCRWSLGSVWRYDLPGDLPPPIFDELRGDNPECPWIFAGRPAAIDGAIVAYNAAVAKGWRPNGDES
jgi:hypothetical protein